MMAVELLNEVTKICKSWCTTKDYASIVKVQIFKEQLAKENEQD